MWADGAGGFGEDGAPDWCVVPLGVVDALVSAGWLVVRRAPDAACRPEAV